MVFNLPLIEAFRGVLEFQRKFCVDQVSGKSVFFRSIPTVSDPEPPTPGMGVASTSGPRGSLGWSGLEMKLLRTGLLQDHNERTK